MSQTLDSGLERFHADSTASNQCGVTLMNTQDGEIVARITATKPDVTIRKLPSMIRVDGIRKIVFDLNEISEVIGREFTPADFEEIMSTHYGRMVVMDDKVVMFANPEDAAEFIDFDLKAVN
jgi:propane monooxygenase coupling protein